MHKSITIFCLIFAVALPLRADLSPQAHLDAGVIAFRVKDYASAEPDLAAAALGLQAGLVPGSPNVPAYERAVIYLALTQFRLGREDDAREAIRRFAAAEKVDPVYNSLVLGSDVADFEVLVAALAPDVVLPKTNIAAAAADDPSVPLPAVTPAPTPPPAPIPAPIPARISSDVVPAATAANLSHFTALRQADALVDEGQTMEAMRIWESLARASDAPREVLIEAAIGLYRIGADRPALAAFERLGNLGRGEEDLRYYHAVVLYETGNFEEARHELACALPFIQVTDDVERYRLKINQPTT